MSRAVSPRVPSLRWASVLGLLALGWAGAAEARTTVATNVTNGSGVGQNPFDKASQRKVVRDAAGACYVVFTQTRCYGAGCPSTPTYQNREVVLARSLDCDTSWQQALLLSSAVSGTEYLYPSIDLSDDRQTLHLVAYSTNPTGVLYTQNASLSGAGWSTADNWKRAGGIDPTPGAVDYDTIATTLSGAPAVAVDSEDRPHVVYVDADASSRPNVFHTRHTGAWTPPVNLSLVTTGVPANLPSALDPSIDAANGYLHVLFKDDSLTGDASPTTDRFRYVRNAGTYNFTTFNAPVTVIQRGTPSAARPGSLAAYGRRVFVVGGFNVLNEYGWRNESADDGATWSQGATGTIFESSILAYTYVVGLNPAAPDHRLATMRADGAQEVYRYGWSGVTWGSRVTTATESGSIPPSTGAHISIEKHKPPSADNIVYCWYNGSSGVDRLYCSLETQAMGAGAPTYLRSIGTALDYQNVGTITVTLGSATVTGSGTAWKTANRGRGDRLTVGANSYVVARVDSNTELTLTAPAVAGASTGTYTIARQFTTLQAWEDCISYTTPCAYFPVGSASLVADDRREIGVAYEDGVFLHSTGGTAGGSPILAIDGAVTDPDHSITLTADGVNRHYGLAGAGVVLDNETNASSGAVFVFDDHVTLEWLEIRNGGGTADGIVLGSPMASDNFFRLHFNLIHDVPGDGVELFQSPLANLTMTHSVVVFTGGYSVNLDPLPQNWSPGSRIRLVNNTFYQSSTDGVRGTVSSPNVYLANNVSHGHVGNDYVFPDLGGPAGPDIDPASRNNLASDASGTPHSPAGGGWDGISFGQIAFNNTTLRDFHLKVGSFGIDKGADESASATPFDVDAQKRPAGASWDVGADEVGGTTAVRLMSFVAVPGDGSVTLEWRTGSEIDNVGFHVWRGPTAEGPWTRITPALVPGAGTSVLGHLYSWLDTGLANGTSTSIASRTWTRPRCRRSTDRSPRCRAAWLRLRPRVEAARAAAREERPRPRAPRGCSPRTARRSPTAPPARATATPTPSPSTSSPATRAARHSS